MSDRKDVVPVVSGAPYLVVSVNQRAPEGLEDFVIEDVTSVQATYHEQVITFHGSGRRDADGVLLYEKDQAGIGKDVRVWRIAVCDGRFEAVERPGF
jgi:hypothetical protein